MRKYDINFKQLALLLLPTFLRRPMMASLTYAVITPLNCIHAKFLRFRNDAAYRLNHNGQVCYLRAALNDTFDPELRRITVTDTAQNVGVMLVFRRDEDRPILVPLRGSDTVLPVNRRGFGGVSGYDFVVNIPLALRGIDEARLTAVADTYKLASKRFAISYY
ncbi:MAG: hypothetical protein NC250_01200 [Alistipes senegalensis]|nr:hypothetical protein [Bacteroides cellulosilyticus]MCM1351335.1 hypothetical protein [Alistipes senegalensis]